MIWLSELTGRHHHYKVVLRYYPSDDGNRYIERIVNVWFKDRSLILDERGIKRAVAPRMINQIPRHLKRNGDLKIREAYYLGWFKPKAGGEK